MNAKNYYKLVRLHSLPPNAEFIKSIKYTEITKEQINDLMKKLQKELDKIDKMIEESKLPMNCDTKLLDSITLKLVKGN